MCESPKPSNGPAYDPAIISVSTVEGQASQLKEPDTSDCLLRFCNFMILASILPITKTSSLQSKPQSQTQTNNVPIQNHGGFGRGNKSNYYGVYRSQQHNQENGG